MADQLATPGDLASLLERSDLDLAKATMLVEIATAIVQEVAGGQRIVQVVDDVATIIGVADSWLDLPQRPVTAVTSVVLDGTALTVDTDYKVFGNRLWRTVGWQTRVGWYGTDYGWSDSWSGPTYYGPPQPLLLGPPEPSKVVVTNTHGYPAGHQGLQLARGAVISMISGVYGNPTGATRESIDDYSVAYDRMTVQMETAPHLKAALRRQYGRRAGLVRLG